MLQVCINENNLYSAALHSYNSCFHQEVCKTLQQNLEVIKPWFLKLGAALDCQNDIKQLLSFNGFFSKNLILYFSRLLNKIVQNIRYLVPFDTT